VGPSAISSPVMSPQSAQASEDAPDAIVLLDRETLEQMRQRHRDELAAWQRQGKRKKEEEKKRKQKRKKKERKKKEKRKKRGRVKIS
jgi:hypothetical protein